MAARRCAGQQHKKPRWQWNLPPATLALAIQSPLCTQHLLETLLQERATKACKALVIAGTADRQRAGLARALRAALLWCWSFSRQSGYAALAPAAARGAAWGAEVNLQ